MDNKDLKDQLEGLFSDLKDVPVSKAEKTEPKPSPRRQRLKSRSGEAVIFNPETTNSKQATQTPAIKPNLLQTTSPPTTHPSPPRALINWRLIIWATIITLVGVMLVIYGQTVLSLLTEDDQAVTQSEITLPLSPTPTLTATITPTPAPVTPEAPFLIAEATTTPTPVAGGASLILRPHQSDVGWLVNDEESNPFEAISPNHFGDSFLYAGVLDGKAYMGAFQFDLRQIPRGTKIHAASLKLTGLRADQLNVVSEAEWQLQLLVPTIDARWSSHTYQQIRNAEAIYTFEPTLKAGALSEETEYRFEFGSETLALLEQRILEGGDNFGRKISFRLVGPTTGSDNLFAWDTGFGPASPGNGPELFLSAGPPPQETPPPYYVMITSTPTPQTIETAAAISIKMTAVAKLEGTATPLPPNWVTPFVVTATPVPGNAATAQAMNNIATAIALTTGEPANIVTASSTPTFVVITSTPTPEAIETAAAQALLITSEAANYGTATPLPENWVTPVVVTVTPTPENEATIAYYQAVALTTGTPTPNPANVQTATPTPVLVVVDPLAVPTETATPSPTPQTIPAELLGKIIFLSDREGATAEERARAETLNVKPEVIPVPYVLDPQTGELARLTDIWPYQVAKNRAGWSADEVYRAYVKELLWTNVRTPGGNVATEVFAIHYYDHIYNVEKVVTNFGAGIAYDPAWSPTSDEIVMVATESGNDEIWRINKDGTNPLQLTKNNWEWDKHPSWSPDGQQIVFHSNRTGNNQIWLMNKDGSEQRLIMEANPYNDFDPVWVKSLAPAPPLGQ